MADVKISQLSDALPSKSSAIIPFSDGSTTYKTSPSGIVAASPGSVIQVIQSVKTDTTTYTGNTDSTIMSLSITPKTIDSKIMISICLNGSCSSNAYSGGLAKLFRNNTQIAFGTLAGATNIGSFVFPYAGTVGIGNLYFNYLDNPNTTSSVTYSIKVTNPDTRNTVIVNTNTQGTYVAMSTITLTEIAG